MKLTKPQRQFIKAKAPYVGFVGGIGSGKSFAGALGLIWRARAGRLYMCCGPTYPVLRDSSIRSFLMLADRMGRIKGFNRSEMCLKLHTFDDGTAEILFRSTENPDRLRGPNLSGVWMDEASLMDHEAFTILIGRLREGGQSGWLSATFTPKGRSHWTYQVFAEDETGHARLFRAPTKSNPFLPPEFYSTLKTQYAGLRADQELEGLFVDIEGAEWPASYFPDSMWFDEWPDKSDYLARAMALDPSKGRMDKPGDYSALVMGWLNKSGILYLDADLRRCAAEELVENSVSVACDFQPDVFVCESNSFQELLLGLFKKETARQQLALPVRGITNYGVKKEVRIRRLGSYLATGKLRFKRTAGAELLVQQLREFPEGKHDDGADSAEMMIRALNELLNGRAKKKPKRVSV